MRLIIISASTFREVFFMDIKMPQPTPHVLLVTLYLVVSVWYQISVQHRVVRQGTL